MCNVHIQYGYGIHNCKFNKDLLLFLYEWIRILHKYPYNGDDDDDVNATIHNLHQGLFIINYGLIM